MNCGACGEQIPADSMFCPECGARQDNSVSGGFAPAPAQSLPPFPQQQRSFDPVSGQAQRMQQENNMNQMGQVPPDMLQGMAQGLHQHQNLPPGTYPQQGQGGFPPNQFPPQQGNVLPNNLQPQVNDMPNVQRGPSIASGALPTSSNVSPLAAGGTKVAHNPANSPTDAMVNRLAEAERAVKDERRSQWLSMNQSPASSVLANLGGGELPAHLRGGAESTNPAANIMAGALGTPAADAPSEALLRRISEVAVRRVARKRGVAVEAPQTKLADDLFEVNITYVDDGRVLDTPEDLTQAFEHAIQTELALKGFDLSCSITMFRSKDGKTEKIGEEAEEEDMFACEICDGLVKESDPVCPHCGAMFEDEDEEEAPAATSRSGPPGPKKGGPPGPKKGGPGPEGRASRSQEGRPSRSEEGRSSRSQEGRPWRPTWSEEERSSRRSEERGSRRSSPAPRRAVLLAVRRKVALAVHPVRRRAVLPAVRRKAVLAVHPVRRRAALLAVPRKAALAVLPVRRRAAPPAVPRKAVPAVHQVQNAVPPAVEVMTS